MASRPQLQPGFLGAQPKFSELKLKTNSHNQAEFEVNGKNNVEIKLDAGQPVKVVTKLTHCGSEEKEYPEYVLIQRKDKDEIRLRTAFPLDGWYKFSIFALEESSETQSLPNVYNYLIHVNGSKGAKPYPKAMSKLYNDTCFLESPVYLSEDKDLDDVKFDIKVPGACKVAIHLGEEWVHLESEGGDKWKTNTNLTKCKGKGNPIKVMANYDKNSNSYDGLLEFQLNP